MKIFAFITAGVSLALAIPTAAQEAPRHEPTAQTCDVDQLNRWLAGENNANREGIRRALEAIIRNGEASSYRSAALVYQERIRQHPSIADMTCVTQPIDSLIMQVAGVTDQTQLPQTQAQAEAEVAAAAAATRAAEAEATEAARVAREAAADAPAAEAVLRSRTPPAARRQAEATLVQLEAAERRRATADEQLARELATLRAAQLTLEQVNAAIDRALNSRFNPQSDDFFLKDPAVVAAMATALQPTFDDRYARKGDVLTVEQYCADNPELARCQSSAAEEASDETGWGAWLLNFLGNWWPYMLIGIGGLLAVFVLLRWGLPYLKQRRDEKAYERANDFPHREHDEVLHVWELERLMNEGLESNQRVAVRYRCDAEGEEVYQVVFQGVAAADKVRVYEGVHGIGKAAPVKLAELPEKLAQWAADGKLDHRVPTEEQPAED